MEVLSLLRHGLHQSDSVNPIMSHFKLGRQVSNAGQEMIWKVFEAHRIADNKITKRLIFKNHQKCQKFQPSELSTAELSTVWNEMRIKASVFLFEKKVADKLHKPKRKELVVELVKRELTILSDMKHPKILKLIHPMEECNASIAFATEPVKACLSNLLGSCDKLPVNIQQELKEQSFLDVELKCGIYQVAEAINYLHVTRKMVHLNVCPQNIIVTRKGVWKLMGFGFAKISDPEALDDHFPSQPWQAKFSKMVQPDLDFVAPEIQSEIRSQATWASDVFSLGMVICWVFNGGRSLLQAAYSPSLYAKQINRLEELYADLVPKIPPQLSDTLRKMIKKEAQARPSVQYVTMLKYFDDPVVETLHMLDNVIEGRDSFVCSKDFIDTLAHNMSHVPPKLMHDCIYPTISENLQLADKVPTTLPVLLSLLDIANEEDYKSFVQVEMKNILTSNQPAQVCVYLLERLDILMRKCSEDEIKTNILPMLFSSLVSNNIQCQEAAINAFSFIRTYLDEQTTRNLVLPKAKALFSKATNVRTRLIALQCIDKLVDSLEKMVILDDILPFLIEIQCFDIDIVMSVVAIYKHLLSDKKYGLTHNLLATKVMPSLVPLTVYPGLSITQFNSLMEILHDMLSQIEQQRLNKMIHELPCQDAISRQRRTSVDTRAGMNSKLNQAHLNVDFGSYRPPSTPEFSIQPTSSRETLENPGYKRHASFQSLGMAEQAVFELVRQRRLSQMSGRSDQGLQNPHIHISQASISTGFKENVAMFFSKHRDSTVSIGPIVLPDFGRRESSGKLFGNAPMRRSSFQGICESAMQYFGVK